MDVLYTAIAHASGGGRDGHVLSEDNVIDLDTRVPKELGGSGSGTNPEQLFAAGYAACFLSALHTVARSLKLDTRDAGVSASVGLGKMTDIAYNIAVELDVYLPNVPADSRDQLVAIAHQTCPYSNATRNNVDVKLVLVD